ncbi:MAG: penicillin-binding protein [Candidatus Colwellbacteria bacterium]|nr:penicillin-binding protein [Candidatus Colwellbacteria bacterium]
MLKDAFRWLGQKRVKTQILIGLAGLVLAGGIFTFRVFASLPKTEEIGELRVPESTKIYDRTDETLLYEVYGEAKRTVIPPDEIPDRLRQATIAIEDNSFYSHPAFDWRGIVRAVGVNLLRGEFAQGGSTITQQLARSAFLTSEKTITRKIKELVLANRLENEYSKDEILDLYLNQVSYGPNIYGVETASQAYFNKGAKDLSLNEVVTLVALPRSPSYYSPWGNHLKELEDRKNFIARRMRELGYIDEAELASINTVLPEIAERPREGIRAPHFSLYIQDYLQEKYGEEALQREGFRVTTSLSWELQEIAEEAVKNGVERNDRLYGGSNGALVAMDPQTGQILALVGSKDYFGDSKPDGCEEGRTCTFEGNFNVAMQGLRQPGSALKPFAYLTAFSKGLTPETIVWDAPTEFNTSCSTSFTPGVRTPGCYHPSNFDGLFRGPVMFKEGLAQSINVPSVKVLYLAGLYDTIDTLSRFGITTLTDPNRYGLSLVLGGGEIKLIELVGAYSTLAADGVYHEPVTILKIENNKGEVLEEYKEEGNKGENVVDPQLARQINDILSDVSLRAPLFHASLSQTQVPGFQVALKTGTTDDYKDAWAFGYAPNLVVGVWAGNNNRISLQSQGSSILAAIPMWHDFMSKALPKFPAVGFNHPAPTQTSNPILRGELVDDGFHSILYYLNRVGDSQYSHWETGIRNWLATHSVDLSRFNVVDAGEGFGPGEAGGEGEINLRIDEPENGDFIDSGIAISFRADSERPISKIEVYFNDRLIATEYGDLGKKPKYETVINPKNIELQNSLVIRVVDEEGLREERELILYRR